MQKIHRKIEYALLSLDFLHRLKINQRASAKQISASYNTPFDTTSRVLQLMKQHNIVDSTQGIQGGYALTANLESFSLFDLHEIILGPMRLANCLTDNFICETECNCTIKPAVSYINDRILDLYKNISLTTLLNCKNPTTRICNSLTSQAMLQKSDTIDKGLKL